MSRFLILVLLVLFILLGYFGLRQMQYVSQLKTEVAIQAQELAQIKQANDQSESLRAQAAKRADELSTANQELIAQISALKDQVGQLTQVKSRQAKLEKNNKNLKASINHLQTVNKNLQTSQKAAADKFYQQNQAQIARIQALTQRIQSLEEAASAAAPPVTPSPVTLPPATPSPVTSSPAAPSPATPPPTTSSMPASGSYWP